MKSRKGDFNIDIKDVVVGVIVAIQDDKLIMSDYEVGIQWEDVSIKFENIAGRFSTIAHLTINEVPLTKSSQKTFHRWNYYFSAWIG